MPAIGSLRKVPLFSGLSDPELADLAGCMVTRAFGRGVFIFHKDSVGHALYIIESGRVRIFVISEAGQEISLNLHGPGEVVGEVGFLDGGPRSASAVTMEPVVAHTLRREDLFFRLEEHPRLAVRFLEILTARLRHTTAYAESLAFLDVNGRVAMRLLELADRFGETVTDGQAQELDLCLTQAELASWVASSRETVNKVLSALREQGMIDLAGPKITILDRTGLRRKIRY